jgi:hypothetical protein
VGTCCAFVLLLAVSAGAAPGAAGAEAPAPPDAAAAFDADAFAKSTPDRRLAFVVAALTRREERMQNFSYELTADGENLPFDPSRPSDPDRLLKVPTERFGVRRSGAQYLFFGRTATPSQDFWSHWDGKVYRTLSFDRRTGEKRAVIADSEQRGMYQVLVNHVVGFRSVGIMSFDVRLARSYAEPATLPEVVEHFLRQRFPTRADVQARGGRALVRLRSLTNARLSPRAWWFDPARDWMTVRFASRDLNEAEADDAADNDDDRDVPAGNINVIEVTDAMQSGGLWVPTKVVCRYRISSPDPGNIQTVRTYVFTDFKVGGVKEGALRVAFPPGTTVADSFAEVSYFLPATLVAEPRPYFVPSARKAVTADEKDLGEALLANPSEDDVGPDDPGRRAAMTRVATRRALRAFASDPLRGRPAPPFPDEAQWLNSGPVKWDELRGKVVVLIFFTGWEAPSRLDLRATAGMAAGRRVVLIGVHPAGAERARVESLAREFEIHYPIVIDTPANPPGAPGKFSKALAISDRPQAVVVDAAGRVVARAKVSDAFNIADQTAVQDSVP